MNERTKIMKALVYQWPGKRAWEQVPDAVVQETTDAVVCVDVVAIIGAGPIGLAAIMTRGSTARVTSSRSTWLIPGWRRHASSAPTWSSTAATTTLCR